MATHANKKPAKEFIQALHEKFGENIATLDEKIVILLEAVDERNRGIDYIRVELKRSYVQSIDYRVECADLLSEVFSDFTIAMHLLSCGVIIPARMMIRRAFELSLAVLYFWDLPQKYWGWIKNDDDIVFSDMTTHFYTKGYQSYLQNINNNELFKFSLSQNMTAEIYRKLSNTVHGKHFLLPPNSPERYDNTVNGIDGELMLAAKVQDLLIGVFCDRFPGLRAHLTIERPKALR